MGDIDMNVKQRLAELERKVQWTTGDHNALRKHLSVINNLIQAARDAINSGDPSCLEKTMRLIDPVPPKPEEVLQAIRNNEGC